MDEIMKLEAGRKLDALVAEKVMGFSDVHEHIYSSGEKQWVHGDFRSLPRFSTDISDAWKVVEKFIEGEFPIDCELHTTVMGWYCDLGDGSANAETAPLAICRAALNNNPES